MTSVYEISSFPGKFVEHQLLEKIQEDVNITRVVQNVRRRGQYVYIDFDSPIGVQKTYLDLLIQSYIPEPQPRVTVTSTPKVESSKSKNYRRVLTWVYKGERKMGAIVTIDCVAYIEPGGESYSINIYDRKHRKTIADATFTNTEEDSVSLPINADNIPEKKSRIEISIKRNGNVSRKVYILGVTFGLR